ncbi:P2X purinoceptor 7-like [Ixodes scapularis]|uniref:P2X purinoceptor 7-like n=1 Tax=Ixodes scapularis TaxID=6945 RepID=UPI001A9CEBAE|nr:P2X purinoceptor 7-like [Ixodes scapularis]XP_040071533.1 P2X purinoceptor 7-like [Ixodes scapularis]
MTSKTTSRTASRTMPRAFDHVNGRVTTHEPPASPPREPPAGVFPIRRDVDPDAASEAEWCSFGSCQPTLPDEDLCCQEMGELAPLLRNGCVTRNELFCLPCLHKDQLEVHARLMEHFTPTYLETSDGNRKLRYTAYRVIVSWAWGCCGRSRQHRLPGCVLRKIREGFPSPEYQLFSCA